METDGNYPAQLKNVIEKIIEAELNKRGITKYISALVKGVNDNGTVNVCIPPNLDSIISGLLNKTGETLSEGDSVELCAKNGSVNNSWVSIKHKTNNSGGGGTGTGDKTFVYSQTIPSKNWNISHNLDKYPSITIVDSAGSEVIGDTVYNSKNEVTIHFTAEFSGNAYLN